MSRRARCSRSGARSSPSFLLPNAVASTALASPSWSSFCSAFVSDSVRIWKFVYRPSADSPRPWMTAPAWPMEPASRRTSSSDVGSGVRNVICVPPLKSMPRLRPFTPMARVERDGPPGDREQSSATDVIHRSQRGMLRGRTKDTRVVDPPGAGGRRGSRASRAPRQHRERLPMRSMSANPSSSPLPKEEHHRRIAVRRSRRLSLAIPFRTMDDSGGTDLPARTFIDAFER